MVRLCSETDVVETSVRRFVVEGRRILLGKFAGKYYALDERCTHRGGHLSEGALMVELSSASGISGSLTSKLAR